MSVDYKAFSSEVAEKLIQKMAVVSEKSKNKIPYTTVDGVHDDKSHSTKDDPSDEGINWWTNGFWAGMMWLLYRHTKEERYIDIARYTENALDRCFEDYYGLHHDVGFMWLHTAVADYKSTGNKESRKRALHAANILAGRFNPVGKFIRAWNSGENDPDKTGWAIIDCLMNIPLLYWATEETKDPRFKQIAMMHADTVMENFIRPDGSSEHIVEFNPETGEKVRIYGGQGYTDGSSWTRGQAWALYGFVISYKHTDKKEYLDTAKRVANYFMANIPKNGLIPIDFRQPAEPKLLDSTAAAIAACGLIELAKYVPELEKDSYLGAAVGLLKALDANACSYDKEDDGILYKCSASYGEKTHEYNIIYGDYFFMEAVFKLQGDEAFLW